MFLNRGNLNIKLLIIQHYTTVSHFYIYQCIKQGFGCTFYWYYTTVVVQPPKTSQYEFNNTSITLQGVLKALQAGWIQDIREYAPMFHCVCLLALSFLLSLYGPHAALVATGSFSSQQEAVQGLKIVSYGVVY